MPSLAHTSERPLPAVDERLVAPESRYEIEDGRIRYVAPSDEPHGTQHSKLSALLEAHVAEDFEAASDMLTRTSEKDDIAPDASVFPSERDPTTGGRQLEQLAFEIANTESSSHAGKKARKLLGRGVRRVFLIDVERRRAAEWALDLDGWRWLDLGASIEDPTLAAPLPVSALVNAAKVDDALALALLRKRNPVIEQALARRHDEGVDEGRAEGKAEALLAILGARRLALTPADVARIRAERSEARLNRWLERAATCHQLSDLWAD